MRKIIVLSQAPLTPQIKRNTYIEEYLFAGFEVEFWDVSQYIHPGMRFNDELQESYIKYISSLVDLEQSLLRIVISDYIFILDFDPFWQTRHIFKLLSQYNCVFVRLDAYANEGLKISFLQKLSKLFSYRFLDILKMKMGLFGYKIYKNLYHLSSFKHYFSSSSVTNNKDKINHPDYEEFFFKEHLDLIGVPYILFVDTFFGYHPDLIYFDKRKKFPDPQLYHRSLNNFFSYLEQKYAMPVIIAAHPKANYTHNEFGRRRIIKYQTKDLIVHADLVILQLCNTSSYVTLANKSVVFVTTDGYDALYKNGLRHLAKTLGKKVYNIDRESYNTIEFSEIEKELRISYIYTYLTDKQTENKKNIEILKESLEFID